MMVTNDRGAVIDCTADDRAAGEICFLETDSQVGFRCGDGRRARGAFQWFYAPLRVENVA